MWKKKKTIYGKVGFSKSYVFKVILRKLFFFSNKLKHNWTEIFVFGNP